MLKLQNIAQLCAFKMPVGFSLLADPLRHLNSSEINSSSIQLTLLSHPSLTKQGVSGPGTLYLEC